MSDREPRTPDAAESSRVRLVDGAREAATPDDEDTAGPHRARPAPSAPRPTTDESRTTIHDPRARERARPRADDLPARQLPAREAGRVSRCPRPGANSQAPRGTDTSWPPLAGGRFSAGRKASRHEHRAAARGRSGVVPLRNESGEKRQRFVESRGECGEAAAAADLALAMDLAPPADVGAAAVRMA